MKPAVSVKVNVARILAIPVMASGVFQRQHIVRTDACQKNDWACSHEFPLMFLNYCASADALVPSIKLTLEPLS